MEAKAMKTTSSLALRLIRREMIHLKNSNKLALRVHPTRNSLHLSQIGSLDVFKVSSPLVKNKRSCFSTQSSAAATSETAAASSKAKATSGNAVADLFFDNLGKVFLLVIFSIILFLVRGSYGSSNMNAVRDEIEESSPLDPLEIDHLRKANSHLTPEVFRQIIQDVNLAFPDGHATYPDFVDCVRKSMVQQKGDAFTVEFGHMLDRVVLSVLKRGLPVPMEDTHDNISPNERMPIALWLTILSLALNSAVPDRIRILYDVLKSTKETTAAMNVVNIADVTTMVRYLQETSQLVADAQIVKTQTKFPAQQYRKGFPEELIGWEGSPEDPVDVDAFKDIITAHAVCAWGECYHRKRK